MKWDCASDWIDHINIFRHRYMISSLGCATDLFQALVAFLPLETLIEIGIVCTDPSAHGTIMPLSVMHMSSVLTPQRLRELTFGSFHFHPSFSLPALGQSWPTTTPEDRSSQRAVGLAALLCRCKLLSPTHSDDLCGPLINMLTLPFTGVEEDNSRRPTTGRCSCLQGDQASLPASLHVVCPARYRLP